MEQDFTKAEERIDNDSRYVYNLSMIHQGEVHPVLIASSLKVVKDYVSRVMNVYNKTLTDKSTSVIYSDDMWIKASDNMYMLVLAKNSEYRALRMKVDDFSYLTKQEELVDDDATTKTSNLSV